MGKTIGYIRCSTEEQADSRAGLDAQRSAILAEAQRRGWDEADLTFVEDAGFSGKNLDRPGIEAALDALRHRKADTLVVSKLDRLSRSLVDFAGLMDRASREKWAAMAGAHVRLALGCQTAPSQTTSVEATAVGSGPEAVGAHPATTSVMTARQVRTFLTQSPTLNGSFGFRAVGRAAASTRASTDPAAPRHDMPPGTAKRAECVLRVGWRGRIRTFNPLIQNRRIGGQDSMVLRSVCRMRMRVSVMTVPRSWPLARSSLDSQNVRSVWAMTSWSALPSPRLTNAS